MRGWRGRRELWSLLKGRGESVAVFDGLGVLGFNSFWFGWTAYDTQEAEWLEFTTAWEHVPIRIANGV